MSLWLFVDGTEPCSFLISIPALLQSTFRHRDGKTSKACSQSRLWRLFAKGRNGKFGFSRPALSDNLPCNLATVLNGAMVSQISTKMAQRQSQNSTHNHCFFSSRKHKVYQVIHSSAFHFYEFNTMSNDWWADHVASCFACSVFGRGPVASSTRRPQQRRMHRRFGEEMNRTVPYSKNNLEELESVKRKSFVEEKASWSEEVDQK